MSKTKNGQKKTVRRVEQRRRRYEAKNPNYIKAMEEEKPRKGQVTETQKTKGKTHTYKDTDRLSRSLKIGYSRVYNPHARRGWLDALKEKVWDLDRSAIPSWNDMGELRCMAD